MGYELAISKTVSRLIPSFLREPKFFHWMSALSFPLVYVNNQFKSFAETKKVEAAMSSQTMLLEGYLNDSFYSYFPNPEVDQIEIVHGVEAARASFSSAEIPPSNPPFSTGHMVLLNNGETSPNGTSPAIFFDYENEEELPEDFRLILPISLTGDVRFEREVTAMLNKYIIDTKTYDIVYA
jgi:hypothetical protein